MVPRCIFRDRPRRAREHAIAGAVDPPAAGAPVPMQGLPRYRASEAGRERAAAGRDRQRHHDMTCEWDAAAARLRVLGLAPSNIQHAGARCGRFNSIYLRSFSIRRQSRTFTYGILKQHDDAFSRTIESGEDTP
jgi:hypothetical protein